MTGNDNSIRQSVTVRASRDVVFKALTAADQLDRWFPTKVESEPRPGGKYKFAFEFAASENNPPRAGTFLEVVPNQKVTYTWPAAPAPAELTTVDFSLSEAGGETVVNLIHSGWGAGPDGDNQREQHAGGWNFFMANLKSYLEEGVDRRAAVLGQRTS